MSDAAKAKAERLTTQERDTYRAAAGAYPTAKEPWTRLAESYFEAGDYGNAILAGQEVLQRDAADQFAASVLAVSGLRVSIDALSTLRVQNGSMAKDTRSEAENLTEKLRELLGQPKLVQPPKPSPPPPPRPRPQGSRTPTPEPATGVSPTPPKRPVGSKDDPFKSLPK